MKRLAVVSMAVLFLASSALIARAEAEEIQLNVNVLPRKVTDTKNDFDFSSVASKGGEVLGAQTEKIPNKSTYRQYVIFALTGNTLLVLLDYYTHK